MASAENMGPKKWRSIWRDSAGKKQHSPAPYFETKRDALEHAQEEEVKARRRAAKQSGSLSARTIWDDWWTIVREDQEFESDTAANRDSAAKHVSKRWGQVPLNEISHREVQLWVNELTREGYSASYVRQIYGVLSTTMRSALSHPHYGSVLDATPLVGIKLPTLRKKQKQYLPVKDTKPLTSAMREDYGDAVLFMAETGIRPGELCGMHVDQLDENNVITVRTVYIRGRRMMRDTPKDGDVRLVPLSPLAMEVWNRRIKNRPLDRGCGIPHFGGTRCESEIVFRTNWGRVMTPGSLYQIFRRYSMRAKLPVRTPYSVRRGFATRIAAGGMTIFDMMEIMGWSDPRLAWEYVQRTPAARARLMAAMGYSEAASLRLVGQPEESGTASGTESGYSPTGDVTQHPEENTA